MKGLSEPISPAILEAAKEVEILQYFRPPKYIQKPLKILTRLIVG